MINNHTARFIKPVFSGDDIIPGALIRHIDDVNSRGIVISCTPVTKDVTSIRVLWSIDPRPTRRKVHPRQWRGLRIRESQVNDYEWTGESARAAYEAGAIRDVIYHSTGEVEAVCWPDEVFTSSRLRGPSG